MPNVTDKPLQVFITSVRRRQWILDRKGEVNLVPFGPGFYRKIAMGKKEKKKGF